MTNHYNTVVIGGGIHGVGVAQAAACRGHSVLLLEKYALAYGTSSRSSKLVHGGLRYLEGFDFSLVRESLRERAILLRIAPGLVRLRPFHIPVYRDTSRRPLTIRAGLTLYAMLGGLHAANRFRKLPRREWAGLDGITTNGLQAVYQYFDAQTNDAELTRAVMQSAVDHGAELACPAEFVTAESADGRIVVSYRQDDADIECTADTLVNAAGPWASAVLGKITPRPQAVPVDLVQGAHLVVEGTLNAGCFYLEAPQDRRAVFLLPWGNDALLGTTENDYSGRPEDVHVLDSETDYLLDVMSHYFPQRSRQVIESFAGLRVLPAAGGRAFERSRETLLPVDDSRQPRIISIFGGKLTGYRATAEKVMDRLSVTLPGRQPLADTAALALPNTTP